MMPILPRRILLAFALVACGTTKPQLDDADTDTDTDADTDSDTDADTDSDTDADTDTDPSTPPPTGFGDPGALPDLTSNLDPTACDGESWWDSTPGSASYFSGSLAHDGTDGELTETWHLFPNAMLQASSNGFDDCVVVWTGFASVFDIDQPTFLIQASMVVDTGSTTCPQQLYASDQTFDSEYEVTTAPGNNTSWVFPEGPVFASGNYATGAATYVTPVQCQAF